jgi:hypothetical protein
MSDRALRALSLYGEAHVFLRGLAVQLGFTTATVAYDRLPRLHGETKYTLAKMVALAINGITSLSVRPIRHDRPDGHHSVCRFPQHERLGLWDLGCGSHGPGLDLGHAGFSFSLPPSRHLRLPSSVNMSGRSISRRNPARAISLKKKSALYRQCLRPKSRVVAQRRRELAKWLFARDSVIGYYAGDRPWKARPNKLR